MRSNTMTQEDWDKLNNMTSKDFGECPFCGKQKGQLMLDITQRKMLNKMKDKSFPDKFFVECGNPDCMARGGFDLDPYKAIEKWNRRA